MGNEWKEYTVKELVGLGIIEKPLDGNHGEIHPKGDDFVENGVPFIMASDLVYGGIDLIGCKFIKQEQASNLRKGFAKEKDVLLSHKATIGRTAIVGKLNSEYIVLTPQITYYRVRNKEKLDNRYLKYYFDSESFQNLLIQWAGGGSTRLYLGITEQLKLPIILPPITAQKFIANILISIDDKIELNRKMNQTLEQMAQTLYKSWFVDFDPVIDNAIAFGNFIPAELEIKAERRKALGNKRKPLPEQIQKLFPSEFEFNDEMDKWIPKEWKIKSLYNMANFINGASFKQDDFVPKDSGIPIIKIAELKSGITNQTKFTNKEISKKYIIDNSDVLYSWSGSPETSLEVFKWFGGKGLLNQHIFKINTKTRHRKIFVYYLLKHLKPILIEIAKNKQTTGLGHITVEDMKKILVPMPPENVESKIVEMFDTFYQQCSSISQQNVTLELLRNTLLPKLISGELSIEKTLQNG